MFQFPSLSDILLLLHLTCAHLVHVSLLLRPHSPSLPAHVRAFSSMANASSAQSAVQSGRVRVLKEGSGPSDRAVGPVVYWMFRDQWVRDNRALIHAVDQANKANVPVAVAFHVRKRGN